MNMSLPTARREAAEPVQPPLPLALEPAEAPAPARRRRRWPWLVLALLIAAGAAFALYRSQSAAPPAPVAAVAPEPTVYALNPLEVTTLAPQTLERTVRVTGSLAPMTTATLRSEVGGTVETVAVREGQEVHRGDPLVAIDTADLEAQLAQQRNTMAATASQLDLARATLARNTTLADRGVITQATLEEAESQVAQLEAQLAALQAQVSTAERALSHASVTSPFDGWIASVAVAAGEAVTANAELLSLVDLARLEVQVTVPTSRIAEVSVGQEVALSVEGIAGETFRATVDRIAPVALEGTRAVPVYLVLDNPGTLRGGMFATGRIVIASAPEALALPPAAIRSDAEGSYVLKVEDGRLVRQPVATGASWSESGLTEIASGLAAGDVVVSAALPGLAAGDAVSLEG